MDADVVLEQLADFNQPRILNIDQTHKPSFTAAEESMHYLTDIRQRYYFYWAEHSTKQALTSSYSNNHLTIAVAFQECNNTAIDPPIGLDGGEQGGEQGGEHTSHVLSSDSARNRTGKEREAPLSHDLGLLAGDQYAACTPITTAKG